MAVLFQTTTILRLRRMRIVGILLVTALAAPVLLGQSPPADPWLDLPSYDSTMLWYLRQGASVKEAKRLLAQNSASPETFKRLVGAGRRDDALLLLKRTLELADAEQTIAAVHALSETLFQFQHDQTRSYTETIRQVIGPARALVARLPREDAARLAREMLTIDAALERNQSPSRTERLTQFARDYDGTEAALLAQVDLLMLDPRQILRRIADLEQFARNHPGTNAGAKALFQAG